MLQQPAVESGTEGRMGSGARKSRPPERFSLDRYTGTQRQSGVTFAGPQMGPPAKRAAVRDWGGGESCADPHA